MCCSRNKRSGKSPGYPSVVLKRNDLIIFYNKFNFLACVIRCGSIPELIRICILYMCRRDCKKAYFSYLQKVLWTHILNFISTKDQTGQVYCVRKLFPRDKDGRLVSDQFCVNEISSLVFCIHKCCNNTELHCMLYWPQKVVCPTMQQEKEIF